MFSPCVVNQKGVQLVKEEVNFARSAMFPLHILIALGSSMKLDMLKHPDNLGI